MIPEWMRPSGVNALALAARGRSHVPRRHSFVRRALSQIAQAAAQGVVAERTAALPGLLQGVDARAKLSGLAVLLVAVTLVAHPALAGGVVVLCIALAAASRLPLRTLARAWLAVPVFSVAVILPATLNVVTPGDPVATLWHFGSARHIGPCALPEDLTLTGPGLYLATRFIVRTMACVSLVLVTTATTRPTALLASLRSLGIPKVFVMVLAMMYRYVALLLRTAEELHLAKRSRSIGGADTRAEQRWVASGIGFVFRRSRRLGEDVYSAMIARGYDGEPRLLSRPAWRLRDGGYVLAAAVIATGLILLDKAWA